MSDGPEQPLRRARLHRSPRYGVFIGSGVLVGVVAALILAAVRSTGGGAVLGYLVVVLGIFGGLLGALVAVLAAMALERSERRSR